MTIEAVMTDDQIKDLCKGAHNSSDYHFARAIEQAVLQSPEVLRLRKDAGRYRWLRTPPNNLDPSFYGATGGLLRRDEYLDAAIDAAMEKQP